MITATNGPMELVVAPDIGGSVYSLTWQGLNMLRPGSDYLGKTHSDPRDLAAFPMVPFVGRIQDGAFHYDGHSIKLPPNMPPEPHAIHGFGWQEPWDIVATSGSTVIVKHEHQPGAWPWHYIAMQEFRLLKSGMTLELNLRNCSEKPMPAGLGWHPYFPAKNASLKVPTTHAWTAQTPNSRLQSTPVSGADDFKSGRALANMDIDQVYAVHAGELEIETPEFRLTMKSTPNTDYTTIYSPDRADYFCAEPITHRPGALNEDEPFKGTGLELLQPRQSMSLQIELQVWATAT